MLLASRSKRWSCFVPVALLALTSGMLAVSLVELSKSPSVGRVVGCAVTLALLLFVAADVRFARDTGSTLVVQTPFGRRELDVATAVVSVTMVQGGRGGLRHEVVATDAAGRSAALAELWSRRGAERACRRLGEALESPSPRRERERVRAEVLGVRAADEAQRAEAAAKVQRYYASGTHRRTLYVVAALLVLYVLGMAVYVYSTGGSL